MKDILLLIFYCVIGSITSDLDPSNEEIWLNFTRSDLLEHDCPNQEGPYASLYYPNRFYECSLSRGRYGYNVEKACPQVECYNKSATQWPRCDSGSCVGKFFPQDLVRNCHLRNQAGPFIHPTDPTRQFRCHQLPGSQRWEFEIELRCAFGYCPTSRPGTDYLPCINCRDIQTNQSMLNAAGGKPEFPKIPDDYMLWDDMWVPKELFNGDLMSNTVKRWPEGLIPYYIDESLDAFLPYIYTAMMDFHQKICIRFIPWSPADGAYIYMFLGYDCFSFVGLQSTKGQQLSLNPSCEPSAGVIIHHLMHAVGFYHEQNRSDRDEFIDILWENITPGLEFNWNKLSEFGYNQLGNFTMDTIMIYSSNSGYKEGGFTMLDKSGNELPNVQQSTSMSTIDAMRVCLLYECRE